ncbi:MAG: DnaA/Hda family protein [Planctomycetia bacterium]|nr:DnaA/Hda family protein [Planctomycetia bacterium]
MLLPAIVEIPLYEKATAPVRSTHDSAGTTVCSFRYQVRPFLAGPENHVICSAIHEFFKESSHLFPLLFYAPFGYGKSHLAEGIFHTWQAFHPQGQAKICSARDFSKHWLTFQKTQTITEFYHIYRKLDLLVLEDIHELVTMDATQEVLIYTLDRFYQRNARVVLTSAQPLSVLPLVPKLASRLRGGVSLRIEAPGIETRRAILDLQEHARGMQFSAEALDRLAERSYQAGISVYEMLTNRRQLEWQRRTSEREEVTAWEVERFFEKKTENAPLTIAVIAKTTAKYYGVRLSDLRSKSRRATLVAIRDVVYYLTRKMTQKTFAEIGEYFGGRDHTTILHGYQQVEQRLKTDPDTRRAVEFLYNDLHPMKDAGTRF